LDVIKNFYEKLKLVNLEEVSIKVTKEHCKNCLEFLRKRKSLNYILENARKDANKAFKQELKETNEYEDRNEIQIQMIWVSRIYSKLIWFVNKCTSSAIQVCKAFKKGAVVVKDNPANSNADNSNSLTNLTKIDVSEIKNQNNDYDIDGTQFGDYNVPTKLHGMMTGHLYNVTNSVDEDDYFDDSIEEVEVINNDTESDSEEYIYSNDFTIKDSKKLLPSRNLSGYLSTPKFQDDYDLELLTSIEDISRFGE